jgi:glutamine amidotransferase
MSIKKENIKIGVVDYGMGNIMSVFNALTFLGYTNLELVESSKKIANSEVLILPGVGAFSDAMVNLENRDLIAPLNQHVLEKKKPILGICLGMQLFLDYSHEGIGASGLGWIPGEVIRFDLNKKFRVPHMGWDNIIIKKECDFFNSVNTEDDFYFVHSYYVNCSEQFIIAECDYGIKFTAAIQSNNLVAFQFHPEKSHTNGLILLENSINNLSSKYNA